MWSVDALQVTPLPVVGVSVRGAVPVLVLLVMRVVVVSVMVRVPVVAAMVGVVVVMARAVVVMLLLLLMYLVMGVIVDGFGRFLLLTESQQKNA